MCFISQISKSGLKIIILLLSTMSFSLEIDYTEIISQRLEISEKIQKCRAAKSTKTLNGEVPGLSPQLQQYPLIMEKASLTFEVADSNHVIGNISETAFNRITNFIKLVGSFEQHILRIE